MEHIEAKPVKKVEKSLRFQRDKDREPVRGIFRFYEVPGGRLDFVFKQYKEDQVEKFSLIDNEIKTLPLGVAKHLNKNGWYPEYAFNAATGTSGGMVSNDLHGHSAASDMRISRKVRRFGFQSLEFVDVDELNNHNNQAVVNV